MAHLTDFFEKWNTFYLIHSLKFTKVIPNFSNFRQFFELWIFIRLNDLGSVSKEPNWCKFSPPKFFWNFWKKISRQNLIQQGRGDKDLGVGQVLQNLNFYFTATSWFPGNIRVKPHSKHSAPCQIGLNGHFVRCGR